MKIIPKLIVMRISVIALAVFLIYGCGSPPKRDAFTGADSTGELAPDFLLGKWQARVLNPIEGEGRHQAIYEYNSDGSWKGTIDASTADGTPVGIFEANGTWQVQGQHVNSTVADIRETSGSTLAGFMLGLMRSNWQKQINRVNPYEVTKDRIVWVEETHGQAMQLDRLPN